MVAEISLLMVCGLSNITRSYDLLSRPTALMSPFFTHTIDERDAVGNILHATLRNEPHAYTYDHLYQLTSENHHIYAYDALHNRLEKDQQISAINALNQISACAAYPFRTGRSLQS